MRTIEIRTTQNVLIDYELATLQDRFIAYFLDIVIFFSAGVFLVILISPIFSDSGPFFPLLLMLLWIGYHFLMEAFFAGQTMGKKVMSIQVVRVDGKEASPTDHFLRAIFMIPDIIFSGAVVGAVLIASSDKRQRFGDMSANTTVVRKKVSSRFLLEDILKIQTLDNYVVNYPEVRRLTEQDMLLIKEVITRSEAYGESPAGDYYIDSSKDSVYYKITKDLVERLTKILELKQTPKRPIPFLKTLIRDYIVLTR